MSLYHFACNFNSSERRLYSAFHWFRASGLERSAAMVSAVPESSNKPATAVYEKNVVIMLSKGFFTTDSVFYTQAHLTVDAMAHDTHGNEVAEGCNKINGSM